MNEKLYASVGEFSGYVLGIGDKREYDLVNILGGRNRGSYLTEGDFLESEDCKVFKLKERLLSGVNEVEVEKVDNPPLGLRKSIARKLERSGHYEFEPDRVPFKSK